MKRHLEKAEAIAFVIVSLLVLIIPVQSQNDNTRCKCICPNPQVVVSNSSDANSTLPFSNWTNRELYKNNVTSEPDKCTCDFVVLPIIASSFEFKGKEGEFCLRCSCKYERRNTKIIMYVVVIVMWIVSLLIVYMLFLMCLEPLLNQRLKSTAYQEHTNEDDEAVGRSGTSHPMRVTSTSSVTATSAGPSSGVLNRVGLQQNKWKRQVQEQRKNIYDRHTMLN